MDFAAKKICLGRFLNAGQVCISPDYVLVHSSKVEKLTNALSKYIKEFWDEGKNLADMGRVVNEFHHNRLCDLLKDQKAAIIIGNSNAFEERTLTPTVVLNPNKDSPLM